MSNNSRTALWRKVSGALYKLQFVAFQHMTLSIGPQWVAFNFQRTLGRDIMHAVSTVAIVWAVCAVSPVSC